MAVKNWLWRLMEVTRLGGAGRYSIRATDGGGYGLSMSME